MKYFETLKEYECIADIPFLYEEMPQDMLEDIAESSKRLISTITGDWFIRKGTAKQDEMEGLLIFVALNEYMPTFRYETLSYMGADLYQEFRGLASLIGASEGLYYEI